MIVSLNFERKSSLANGYTTLQVNPMRKMKVYLLEGTASYLPKQIESQGMVAQLILGGNQV